MSGLEIGGGIGLIIFGVRFLRKGLDRLFGQKLVHWLARTTAKPLRAFGSGILMGTIAPSSTGLSLAAAQMLHRGEVNSQRMLAVLLGANVGMTVTIQLVAFRIHDYAGLFILAGVIAFLFLSRELFRGIGQCLLALGFIFLAVRLIGAGAREATQSAEVVQLFQLLQVNHWVVFVAVAAMAVLLQSSTATIVLGLGLAASGLVTPVLLIPWVVAANVGIGITSLIAGWKQLEGRRLGFANLVTKALVALPFVCFPWAAEPVFTALGESTTRQAAMFHSGFNLVVGLVALPFLGLIYRMTRFLISPAENEDLAAGENFLDPSVLETPSIALARATRETLRLADHVRVMLEQFWNASLAGDVALAHRVQKKDDVIDKIYLDIKDYLSRIGEDKSPADTQWQFTLLTFSNELESVGDLIDRHLCDLLAKQESGAVLLEEEDQRGLTGAYRRVLDRFEMATGLLTSRDREQAAEFLAGKEAFNDWCRELQVAHYRRLSTGASHSAVMSSAFFLDFLNGLRRINSHISSLGYAFRKG